MPRDKKMKAAEDDGHGIWMKTPRTDRKQSQRLKKKKNLRRKMQGGSYVITINCRHAGDVTSPEARALSCSCFCYEVDNIN